VEIFKDIKSFTGSHLLQDRANLKKKLGPIENTKSKLYTVLTKTRVV